jgi:hypothetical protein
LAFATAHHIELRSCGAAHAPVLECSNHSIEPLQDLIAAYRSTAIAWDGVQGDAKRANPLFKRLHAIYKQLRDQPLGRQAISELMDDDSVSTGVRLTAASHSLGWEPERAVRVLEAIESEGPGLYRVTAKYTLKSFREGSLNMDW